MAKNYYPSESHLGTLMFEDVDPALTISDEDYNDLCVRYQIITEGTTFNTDVTSVTIKGYVFAYGAALSNGLHWRIDTDTSDVLSNVTTHNYKIPDNKCLICHLPPGYPENAQTLKVGTSAVKAHLAHGDYLGACDGDAGFDDIIETDPNNNKAIILNISKSVKDDLETISPLIGFHRTDNSDIDDLIVHSFYIKVDFATGVNVLNIFEPASSDSHVMYPYIKVHDGENYMYDVTLETKSAGRPWGLNIIDSTVCFPKIVIEQTDIDTAYTTIDWPNVQNYSITSVSGQVGTLSAAHDVDLVGKSANSGDTVAYTVNGVTYTLDKTLEIFEPIQEADETEIVMEFDGDTKCVATIVDWSDLMVIAAGLSGTDLDDFKSYIHGCNVLYADSPSDTIYYFGADDYYHVSTRTNSSADHDFLVISEGDIGDTILDSGSTARKYMVLWKS